MVFYTFTLKNFKVKDMMYKKYVLELIFFCKYCVLEKNTYFQENSIYIQTLVDKALEFIDPTPNIHTLFVQFNARFFWNVLSSVQVKWSNRMTR